MFMTCESCKEPTETYWAMVGDPPEICAADHRPPKWQRHTRCCHKPVGDTIFGYESPDRSQTVAPRIGL